MDALNIDQLLALLESLQTAGVEEFNGFGFHVKFAAACFTPDRIAAQTEEPAPEEVMRAEPEDLWTSKTLWGTEGPPKFPGQR